MADLLAKILTLPEAERWELVQAILDSLKPPTDLAILQAQHAEKVWQDWHHHEHPGYTPSELTDLIEQKRVKRNSVS